MQCVDEAKPVNARRFLWTILTEKCGIPKINSLVPSNGSTIQTLFLFNLSCVSTVSSESQPSLGNSPIKKSDRYWSASLSATIVR